MYRQGQKHLLPEFACKKAEEASIQDLEYLARKYGTPKSAYHDTWSSNHCSSENSDFEENESSNDSDAD